MERINKMLLILAILLVAFSMENAEGGRVLKRKNEEVDHPQNFFGGAAGGVYPGPSFATGIGFGPSGFYTYPSGGIATGGLPTFPGTPVVSEAGIIVLPSLEVIDEGETSVDIDAFGTRRRSYKAAKKAWNAKF